MSYLDNAATTKPKFFAKDYPFWGNPNSPYMIGLEVNKKLEKAKSIIMRLLNVNSGTVFFCRCATEAIEWLCGKFRGDNYFSDTNFILSREWEHDSVYSVVDNTDPDNISFLLEGRDCKNKLFLCQLVNHITGVVFQNENIGIKIRKNGGFFGSDITAALGKYEIPNNLEEFCDAVWFSGRKIHCEPMGAIWISDRLFEYLAKKNKSIPIHGTPNVQGAMALSDAVFHAVATLKENESKWDTLYDSLFVYLKSFDIKFRVVKDNCIRSKAINAITFDGIDADALIQYLSKVGVYISPGHSACADDASYRELLAFGLSETEAKQTVRVSFSEDTDIEDIRSFVYWVNKYRKTFL